MRRQTTTHSRGKSAFVIIIQRRMRLVICFIICVAAIASDGCFSCNARQDPDALKRKTAEATATLKSDTKAVGQGIAEGLRSKPKIDLNGASESDLQKLPGVTPAIASKIVSHRPYDNPDQLVTRRVLTQAEYDQISDRITVKK